MQLTQLTLIDKLLGCPPGVPKRKAESRETGTQARPKPEPKMRERELKVEGERKISFFHPRNEEILHP